MLDVLVDVTRTADVLHQEDPVAPQGRADRLEHLGGFRLVVDGIERGDEVEVIARDRLGRVAHFEADVVEPDLPGVALRRGDRLDRQIAPDEPAARECLGHPAHGAAPATAYVEHVDPRVEPLRQARHCRQDLLDEDGDHGLVALLRHHCVEAVERAVRTPPPRSKHSTTSSSTEPSSGIHCMVAARFAGRAARVRLAACSVGRS